MAYSQNLIRAALDQNTKEVFLFLLTFTGGSITEPVRLVNNLEDVTSRGNSYMAFPLDLTLPIDDGDSMPSIKIVCQNASLQLIETIRNVGTVMYVKLEMILASSPDYIEASIENMRVSSVQYDKDAITMTCAMDDLLNTAFGRERYLPSNFPGLFK